MSEHDLRRAFVDGAKWWEFTSTKGTMWASDRDKAEAEAERRYPSSDCGCGMEGGLRRYCETHNPCFGSSPSRERVRPAPFQRSATTMPPINADGHALMQFQCDRCGEFMSRRVSCPDCDAPAKESR